MAKESPDTRQQILRAALQRFADAGYAATSVQQIVTDRKLLFMRAHLLDAARVNNESGLS